VSTLVERWANLRDREALGDALNAAELDDVVKIENEDPEVQAYVSQMRELESYLEGKPGEHPTTPDHQLVLRALSAVQLDAPGPRVRAIDHDRELARAADPEGPGWIRVVATALSVGMTVAAALALVLYEPRSVRRGVAGASHVPAALAAVAPSSGVEAPQPKVEALLQVRASDRGARLRRAGESSVLGAGALLGQGDKIESGERAGCFIAGNQLEFCLSGSSAVSLKALAENDLVVVLEKGHLGVHIPAAAQGRRFAVLADDVQITGEGPLSFGVEKMEAGNVLRARVLRGRVRVSVDAQNLEVGTLKAAVYRRDTRELDTVDLAPGPAQHEWELIGTGRLGASVAAIWSTPDRSKNAVDQAQPELADVDSAKAPRELMQEAWELLKDEQWSEAAQTYQRIAREAPASEEAHIVLVRLGDLLLERLADPEGALAVFDRYLRDGGGPLAAEARHGRIAVFRRLGRADDERSAIEEFLRLHEQSSDVAALEARLRVLTPSM
jgi:hypothetical protein